MKFILISLILISINSYAKDIIFGIVPQQSPKVIFKKWLPIVQELSKKTGYKIILKTESSIPKFEKALYAGKYDVAYMNPYHFVIANKTQGYNAMVRSSKSIQGIILSRNNKKLEKNNILGATFLFPAPKAFAATLLTKYEIFQKFGINIDKNSKVVYVNSHDSVYKGIGRGIGDFGGGIVRTFKSFSNEKTKQDLSLIYKTNKYPSHPIAINSNLSKEIEVNIKQSLLSISIEKLNKLNIPNLKSITNDEYKDVKKLAIDLEIY